MLKLSSAKPLFFSTCIIALSTFSAASLASGTFSAGSNNNSQNAYNLGKKVFHKKLACKTCILPKKKLNQEEAQQLVSNLGTKDEFLKTLSKEELEATIIYLSKRYKLN